MHLERWTIDEMSDATATLLRSVYEEEFDPSAAGDLKEIVMQMELVIGDDERWSEETDFILNRQQLEAFLNDPERRSGRREFPEPRPVRESDVYWIVSPDELPAIDEAIGPDRTGEFLATYQHPAVEVWDVTPAARQAARVNYNQALKQGQQTG